MHRCERDLHARVCVGGCVCVCACSRPANGLTLTLCLDHHRCRVHPINRRPVLGFINFCQDWADTPHTLMAHEVAHLLGFNSVFFESSFPYFGSVGDGLLGLVDGGAVQFVRDHYGCQSIQGIPSLKRHHFDPLFVGDDLMQPCVSFSNEYRISEIFAHIMQEIGWPVVELQGNTWTQVHKPFYNINFSFVDKQLFGYQFGCDGYGYPRECSDVVTPNGVKCMMLCTRASNFQVPTTQNGAEILAPTTQRSVAVAGTGHSSRLSGVFFCVGLSSFLVALVLTVVLY